MTPEAMRRALDEIAEACERAEDEYEEATGGHGPYATQMAVAALGISLQSLRTAIDAARAQAGGAA
jgi:hypothetical protein